MACTQTLFNFPLIGRGDQNLPQPLLVRRGKRGEERFPPFHPDGSAGADAAMTAGLRTI